MHDGKIVYALIQRALWNRKHTPFLLCKCKRGDAVRNADHVCELIDHDEYLILNEKLSNSGTENKGKKSKG